MSSSSVFLKVLRRLSVAERIQLVEDLWDTIVEDSPADAFPITPELAAELDRRLAEHEADPSTAIPWEMARARISKRIRDAGKGPAVSAGCGSGRGPRSKAMYPIVHGRVRRHLLRRFPYGLFYVQYPTEVVILAVVHGRRHPRARPSDPGAWLSLGLQIRPVPYPIARPSTACAN